MAITKDYLQSVLWPKYKGDAESLCQSVWCIANPKQGKIKSPEWFNEIIENQLKSMLMIVFSAGPPWVVFLEPLPGYSVVIYKKPQKASKVAPLQELVLKNHTMNQFSELAQLVEKALVRLIKKVISSGHGDVIELENEDGHVFIFPRHKINQYLKELGFSDEQIPQLISLEDVKEW